MRTKSLRYGIRSKTPDSKPLSLGESSRMRPEQGNNSHVSLAGSDRSAGHAPAQSSGSSGALYEDWLRQQVEREPYWFHKMELPPDIMTAGWSDPKKEKLPYFGLPEDMTGMSVLDVGCAEGFFSFEAERRGAKRIVAIDSFPDSIRRFGICRDAYDSRATGYLQSVYDLDPRKMGTFDMVFFFGVLYHLRHPLLALEKILSVCTGTMLLQTAIWERRLVRESVACFTPFGIRSGPKGSLYDPTVFWRPNRKCVLDMALSVGFRDVEVISSGRKSPFVVRAKSPVQAPGYPPDQSKAPWS